MSLELEKILGTDTGKEAFYKADRNFTKIENEINNTSVDAKNINYDNTASEMTAENVQDAIDELRQQINSLEALIEFYHPQLFLYNLGDEYSDLTGGWSIKDQMSQGPSYGISKLTKNSYNMELYTKTLETSTTHNTGILVGTEPIDLTRYNKIYMEYDYISNYISGTSTFSNIIGLAVLNSTTFVDNWCELDYTARIYNSYTEKKLLTGSDVLVLDISNVQEIKNIGIVNFGTSQPREFTVNVKRIWLE